MSYMSTTMVLGADVAHSGTFTVGYTGGLVGASFAGASGRHRLIANGATYSVENGKISVSFGATSATVTWNGGRTLAAGTQLAVEFDLLGEDRRRPTAYVQSATTPLPVQTIAIGAPAAGAANSVATSQAVNAGVPMVLNGSLAAGGVATFDVPRNVVAAWTGTAIATVVGTDVYGRPMAESSASGTSLTGKKAFKRITGVTFSANVTAATAGTGNVFGLPFFLAQRTHVLAMAVDDVDELATSTVVAGVATASTATSGDVRGTVTFATAPNGSRVLTVVAIGNPADNGLVPYSV